MAEVNLEKIRQMKLLFERASSSANVSWTSFFIPKPGKNRIRFLESMKEGEFDFQRFGRHFIKGKYEYCPRILSDGTKPCPICNVVDAMLNSESAEVRKFANTIRVKEESIWIIIDRDSKPIEPKFFIATNFLTRQLLDVYEEFPGFTKIKEGRDCILNRPSKLGDRYTVSVLDKSPLSSDPSDLKRILDAIPDFNEVKTRSYEELSYIIKDIVPESEEITVKGVEEETKNVGEKTTGEKKSTKEVSGDSVIVKGDKGIEKEMVGIDEKEKEEVKSKGNEEVESEIENIIREARKSEK